MGSTWNALVRDAGCANATCGFDEPAERQTSIVLPTMKNLAAFTAPSGIFPNFVSINAEDSGAVSITVREAIANAPGATPQPKQAKITLTAEEWAAFKAQLA